MNRFAALNCISRAEPVALALNRLVPRFTEKVANFPQNKLIKSFSIFAI